MTIRQARADDLDAVMAFGATHVPPHYEPIIGRAAARRQVDLWWTREYLAPAVDAGALIVAEANGEVIGIAQWGDWDGDPVVWKLYIHPEWRGQGVGPALLRAVEADLPTGTPRLLVEHFAGNHRAAAFYEREGFVHLHTDAARGGDPAAAQVWRARDLSN